jgi:hypothetical protein
LADFRRLSALRPGEKGGKAGENARRKGEPWCAAQTFWLKSGVFKVAACQGFAKKRKKAQHKER